MELDGTQWMKLEKVIISHAQLEIQLVLTIVVPQPFPSKKLELITSYVLLLDIVQVA